MPAGVSSWDYIAGLAIALQQILHESQTNIVSSRYLPLRSFAVPARLYDSNPNVIRVRSHKCLPYILVRAGNVFIVRIAQQ